LGLNWPGEVDAVGEAVTQFKKGDQVFGIGSDRFARTPSTRARPENGALAIKPADLSYEEAASLPFGAGTAVYFLRDKAKINRGQKVLVNGASGGLVFMRYSWPKTYGAEVTGGMQHGEPGIGEVAGRRQDY